MTKNTLTDDKISRALDAAMAEFDWAMNKNAEVMEAEGTYRLHGFDAAAKSEIQQGQIALHKSISAIRNEIRAKLETAIRSPNINPCAANEKYKRIMFAGPLGSEAGDLMRKCLQEGIDAQPIPQQVKDLLHTKDDATLETLPYDGLVVDMDALRKEVPGFENLYANDPQKASSIVRSVVSAWTWAYYKLADETNVNIWSNETMSSGVYGDKKWLDEKLGNVPVHMIAVMPPAEGRLEALQRSAIAQQAQTGAAIPPAQIAGSLDVIQRTALNNMQAYGWPGFVLAGAMGKGFTMAASHSPHTGIKRHDAKELAGFAQTAPDGPANARQQRG